MVQFCYALLYFATGGKDGHGLKLDKVGPTFSTSSTPAKINHQKKNYYG